MGAAAAVFNIGLIVSGLLLILGIFPEPYGRLHHSVSVAFFLPLPTTIYLHAVSTLRHSRSEDLFEGVSATIALGVWSLPWSSPAIPEALSALSATLWLEKLAISLLRN